MSQQFVFDSRLPVSDSQSESDPNHPKNVMRQSQVVSAQASADTKYDISPPPRVDPTIENFVDFANDRTLFYASLAAALVSILLLLQPRPTLVKYGLVAVAIFSLHYAAGKMEKRAVYN